jgi:hypothetical protein
MNLGGKHSFPPFLMYKTIFEGTFPLGPAPFADQSAENEKHIHETPLPNQLATAAPDCLWTI